MINEYKNCKIEIELFQETNWKWNTCTICNMKIKLNLIQKTHRYMEVIVKMIGTNPQHGYLEAYYCYYVENGLIY